jgi:glycosyltransferase involved in cell wall biosynthesis
MVMKREKSKEAYPRISVVTPSYNQGRFIEDAIKSVIEQCYPNFEHIIIDNCSKDETVPILKKYPHLIWVWEPDKGQSDAINKGFLKATGDIVAWLNADDYYLPGAFRRVVGFWKNHLEADVVYGDCYFVDKHKNIIRKKVEGPFSYSLLLYYGCYIASTSTFFGRRIIDQGHLLDVSYHYTMDFEYLVRLARLGMRFEYLREFLASARFHGRNKSDDVFHRSKERFRVQRTYGISFLSDKALEIIAYPFKAIHQFRKIVSGAYVRQWQRSEADGEAQH